MSNQTRPEQTRPQVLLTRGKDWHDVSLRELTFFFLKVVVSALPAIALSFVIYMLTFLSIVTASGFLR